MKLSSPREVVPPLRPFSPSGCSKSVAMLTPKIGNTKADRSDRSDRQVRPVWACVDDQNWRGPSGVMRQTIRKSGCLDIQMF